VTETEAKVILRAYRPWVDDAQDAEVATALAVVRANPEGQRWFEEHCARQIELRAKLQGIKAPEALRQQILSEQRMAVPLPWWQRRAVVAMLACVVIGFALVSIWRTIGPVGAEDLSFAGYRQRMVRTALRAYGMDLETNDVAQVRSFLAAQRAPADFVLPAALAQPPAVGCGVLSWQGKPVTMVCFRTGRPLEAGSKSDLFLFVIAGKDVKGSADLAEKQFAKVSDLATASWRDGDKVYVLAAFTESDVKQRL